MPFTAEYSEYSLLGLLECTPYISVAGDIGCRRPVHLDIDIGVTDLHVQYVFVFTYSRFNTCIWTVAEYGAVLTVS